MITQPRPQPRFLAPHPVRANAPTLFTFTPVFGLSALLIIFMLCSSFVLYDNSSRDQTAVQRGLPQDFSRQISAAAVAAAAAAAPRPTAGHVMSSSAPAPPAFLRMHYAEYGYFDPTIFNISTGALSGGVQPQIFSARPPDKTMMEFATYNPSIVRLTPELLDKYPRLVEAEARFLVVARRDHKDQCTKLGGFYNVTATMSSGRLEGRSAFVFLDQRFRVVPIEIGVPNDMSKHYDARLHLRAGTVLLSFTGEHVFRLSELLLDWSDCPAGATVRLEAANSVNRACRVKWQQKPVISKHSHIPNFPHGKNFGLFWYNESLFLQTWLATAHTLPADMVPVTVAGTALGVFGDVAHVRPTGSMLRQTMHNSGINDLLLPGGQSRLMMGHTCLKQDNVPKYPEYFGVPEFRTEFGGGYFQYFVLTDPDFPYAVQNVSRPFCVPSLANPQLCEVIQFVMSALLVSNNQDILLLYGINDCESAGIRVRVRDLVAFTHGRVPRLVFSSTPVFADDDLPPQPEDYNDNDGDSNGNQPPAFSRRTRGAWRRVRQRH